MAIIKKIYEIDGFITAKDFLKIEENANNHLKLSNITFKVMVISANGLFVKSEQGKHFSESYVDADRLIEITKDLFSGVKFSLDIDPGHILTETGEIKREHIMVDPHPFKLTPVDLVDYKWVNEHMLEYGIRVKDIQARTGIEKTSISAWINNKKPMSQTARAMFFNFFKVHAIKHLLMKLSSDDAEPYYIKNTFDKELITKLVEYSDGFKITPEDTFYKIAKSGMLTN